MIQFWKTRAQRRTTALIDLGTACAVFIVLMAAFVAVDAAVR